MGKANSPPWLDSDWLLGQFSSVSNDACTAYEKFVANGVNAASPLRCVQYQLLLRDQAFVERFLEAPGPDELIEVCREQRRVTELRLEQYATKFPEHDQATAEAYFSTAFTMAKIANHFHVSYQTVSRAIRRFEKT